MKTAVNYLLLMLSAAGTASAALTDNLVAYWNFEGSANNHAAASGGAAYNGTLIDNAALSGGAVRVGSGSLNLDGAGDYMRTLNTDLIGRINSPWSIQAWYRVSPTVPASTTRYMVFENSVSVTGQSVSPISLGLREGTSTTNTNVQVYTKRPTLTGDFADLQVADTATLNTWHHFLLVFTPATASETGSVKGYLNGKLTHTIVLPVSSTLDTANINGLNIGTFREASGRWFKGAIDEVAFWNRSLSAADAVELFYRGQANQGVADTVTDPALENNLLAYYNFDEPGSPGLFNKAPGATGYHGTRGQWIGTDPDWATGVDATGPGFAGNAAFNGEGGTSDRSTLLVGNALNFSDARDEFVNVPLGAAQTGTSFTLAAWHALKPASGNNSNRYHVFEPGDTGNYDISWGTNAVTTTTGPLSSYTYLAFLAGGPAGGFGPGGVTTGPWHQVTHVFTSDGTKLTLSVYVDGVFVEARNENTAGMDFTSINLGRARPGTDTPTDRDWDGMLDEVAVWNRALSPTQVQELFTRGSGGNAIVVSNKFTLALSAAPSGSGTVTGSGFFDPNSQVPVAATPNPGYVFSAWDGGFTGQPASFTHTVTANVTATATFGPDTADADHDGLTNYDEIVIHQTLPDDSDTDNDGIPDGAEVNQTGTNPTQDDSALVDFVRQNLSPATAGGIAMDGPVIERDPLTGALSLRLAFYGSADQRAWSLIPLGDPGVSITVDGTYLNLTVPAPSATVDSYILLGKRP